DLVRRRQRREQPRELLRLRERRRTAAEEDGLQLRREQPTFELELCEQRVHVRGVLRVTPDDRHEVAVAAPVRAERQVHVQMTDVPAHRRSPFPRLSTARNASWGTSTIPTCFIRRFPAFCFSSSLRLRVMSPP